MAEQIARWRAIAELDARHGTPVGDALREAAAEVERLRAMEQRVRKLRAEWKQGAVSARSWRDQADRNRDVTNMLRENAWMTAYIEFGKEIDAALDGTEAGR